MADDPQALQDDNRRNRLILDPKQFDDYWIALLAKIRFNEPADRLLSGQAPHPLIPFQQQNAASLAQLGVAPCTIQQLFEDPIGCYIQFSRSLDTALQVFPNAIPALTSLQQLEDLFTIHKRAERFIYNVIVGTLQVGKTMHYARRARFGAGCHLLSIIRQDNRQTTTRSLMALFSTLLSLKLRDDEVFEAFARRLDSLIQRLANWRPPVVLPEQLLLFCALRALPDVPYGPVRHIILASPNITYPAGMDMLRDVANTGAQLIQANLGSGEPTAKPSAVLCASDSQSNCDKPKSRPRRSRRRPRGPSELCKKHGPCKHHGPSSFHATSECRDPTLSRRKNKEQAQLAGVATTSPPPSSDSTNPLYTPMLVTRISNKAHSRPNRSQY